MGELNLDKLSLRYKRKQLAEPLGEINLDKLSLRDYTMTQPLEKEKDKDATCNRNTYTTCIRHGNKHTTPEFAIGNRCITGE